MEVLKMAEIIDYETKLLSRIDIIDMELEEGKITKKQHRNIKQKLLLEIRKHKNGGIKK